MTEFLQPPVPRPIRLERRQADLAEIRALPRTKPRSARRRNRWFAGLGALVLVAAGGGVATAYRVLEPAPATETSTINCYPYVTAAPTAPPPGTEASVGFTIGDGPEFTTEGSDGVALDECARLWRNGEVVASGKPGEPPPPGTPPKPVPELSACVLASGAVGVFPAAPEVCAQLGYPPFLTPDGRPNTRPAETP